MSTTGSKDALIPEICVDDNHQTGEQLGFQWKYNVNQNLSELNI